MRFFFCSAASMAGSTSSVSPSTFFLSKASAFSVKTFGGAVNGRSVGARSDDVADFHKIFGGAVNGRSVGARIDDIADFHTGARIDDPLRAELSGLRAHYAHNAIKPDKPFLAPRKNDASIRPNRRRRDNFLQRLSHHHDDSLRVIREEVPITQTLVCVRTAIRPCA